MRASFQKAANGKKIMQTDFQLFLHAFKMDAKEKLRQMLDKVRGEEEEFRREVEERVGELLETAHKVC